MKSFEIELSERAQDYLIDNVPSLDKSQQQEVARFFDEFTADPLAMAKEPAIPIGGPFYAERRIGGQQHIRFHFDVRPHPDHIKVTVDSAWIGYLM